MNSGAKPGDKVSPGKVVNENGEVTTTVINAQSNGYGTTGKFLYNDSDAHENTFDAVYVIGITENGTKVLSPVYEFTQLKANVFIHCSEVINTET